MLSSLCSIFVFKNIIFYNLDIDDIVCIDGIYWSISNKLAHFFTKTENAMKKKE